MRVRSVSTKAITATTSIACTGSGATSNRRLRPMARKFGSNTPLAEAPLGRMRRSRRTARGRNELKSGEQEIHRQRSQQIRNTDNDDHERIGKTDREAEGEHEGDRFGRVEPPDHHGEDDAITLDAGPRRPRGRTRRPPC